MPHFVEAYAEQIVSFLRKNHSALFFRQEILEVPTLATALVITFDGVIDDVREVHDDSAFDKFAKRIEAINPELPFSDRALAARIATEAPQKVMSGYQNRTIYFIRGGSHPEHWTPENAQKDASKLMVVSTGMWGGLVEDELQRSAREIPTGKEHFSRYERLVRVTFNYLFHGPLGEGVAQSRTIPEVDIEGLEIRDVIFANRASSGFWFDLKQKYQASEIVVDAKNTSDPTRDDIRQLYCYLKPALGYWGLSSAEAFRRKRLLRSIARSSRISNSAVASSS